MKKPTIVFRVRRLDNGRLITVSAVAFFSRREWVTGTNVTYERAVGESLARVKTLIKAELFRKLADAMYSRWMAS